MTVQHDKALACYCVYKHTSPSGKVYIGITRNSPSRRWKGGRGYVVNDHFFRAILKYGWDNFQHEIVAEGLTEEQAVDMERALIAAYNSTDPKRGYNRDPGGGVRSQETAAKISKALTGVPLSAERRERMSRDRKGRTLSDECKHKISESIKNNPKAQAHLVALNKARAGHPQSAEHRAKIAEAQPRRREVVNLDTGNTYASVHEAATACGGAHANIVKACTGQRRTAYGYHWAYKEATRCK